MNKYQSEGAVDDAEERMEERVAHLYLDLMKRCLLNSIYGDDEYDAVVANGFLERLAMKVIGRRGLKLMRRRPFDPEKRSLGLDWPPTAHTMIGLARLTNLQSCIQDVLERGVPGDLVETGVWRGGATILMAQF